MYQIRKCERFTSWQTSEVATLDPEKFKNISVPFTGETEEEFLNYIQDNRYELEEIYDEIEKELGEETLAELGKLWSPEWTEYSNSKSKGEESWFESGKENPEYRKTGGFEVQHTTDNY